MDDDFPRAHCHEEEVQQRIQAHEEKYSTPVNEEEIHEIMMGVHADHEDCECSCCESA